MEGGGGGGVEGWVGGLGAEGWVEGGDWGHIWCFGVVGLLSCEGVVVVLLMVVLWMVLLKAVSWVGGWVVSFMVADCVDDGVSGNLEERSSLRKRSHVDIEQQKQKAGFGVSIEAV